MPTAALRQITAKQDNQALRARLEAEAARVQISYKASVIDFMVMEGIQDFSELDYATRKSFEAYLEGQSGMKHIRHHLLAFDKLKQHALSQEFHILEDGKVARPRYENGILYLPYHPDPKVSAMFRNSTRKNEHVWDFSRNAPERMKRQVFDILHYELENSTSPEGRRVHLLGLRDLYDFCTEQWIEDIEAMELPQIQAFREIPSNRLTESKRPGIINFCRRALFLQAEEINWNAHVWYMERFHIQPERMDPANPVLSISFVEVTHRRNRELLKRYIRYGLGITNLSVGVIRGELIYLRSFLNDIQQPEDTDICSVTPAQMEAYFRVQRQRGVQAETYNMLCHHTGKRPLGCCVLQSSSRLKCPQPVRIIPGIFLGFLLQRVSTKPHLLVKYGVDFRLCNIASLLTKNSRLDFSNRLCSISFIYNGI